MTNRHRRRRYCLNTNSKSTPTLTAANTSMTSSSSDSAAFPSTNGSTVGAVGLTAATLLNDQQQMLLSGGGGSGSSVLADQILLNSLLDRSLSSSAAAANSSIYSVLLPYDAARLLPPNNPLLIGLHDFSSSSSDHDHLLLSALLGGKGSNNIHTMKEKKELAARSVLKQQQQQQQQQQQEPNNVVGAVTAKRTDLLSLNMQSGLPSSGFLDYKYPFQSSAGTTGAGLSSLSTNMGTSSSRQQQHEPQEQQHQHQQHQHSRSNITKTNEAANWKNMIMAQSSFIVGRTTAATATAVVQPTISVVANQGHDDEQIDDLANGDEDRRMLSIARDSSSYVAGATDDVDEKKTILVSQQPRIIEYDNESKQEENFEEFLQRLPGFDNNRRRYDHEAFPAKLHRMLQEAEKKGLSHIVSWAHSGKAFRVMDPVLFEHEIGPKYFRHRQYNSFRYVYSSLLSFGFECFFPPFHNNDRCAHILSHFLYTTIFAFLCYRRQLSSYGFQRMYKERGPLDGGIRS
jgi:HSF-type DNA-binding